MAVRVEQFSDLATTRLSRHAGSTLAGLVALSGMTWLLLASEGAIQASLLLSVLITQCTTGALLWRFARPVSCFLTELVGMGLAVGTLTALLSAQLLRPTPVAAVGWLLPTAVVAVGLAVPVVRRRLRAGSTAMITLDEAATVGLGIGIGLIFVRTFWRAHPITWDGWRSYYVDIPYHEALAVSLATWGPDDSSVAVGEPIRYHWFTHAWAGATTNASAADSFVVMTRALPLVSLVGIVCLAWAWSRRLSDRRSVPFLAVLMTTLAMDVGSRLEVNLLQNFTVSPSMGLAALWLLGGSLVFSEHLAGQLRYSQTWLALFAVGCVGGKTSNAAVFVGGVGLAALFGTRRPGLRARAWRDLGVVLAAVMTAFMVLIAGSTDRLTLELGASARTYSFLRGDNWIGISVGTLAVALSVAAKWAGLAILAAVEPIRRPEVWYAGGVAVTGLLLMAVLGHPGASQLYFPLSASVVLAIFSAWGIGEGLARLSSQILFTTAIVGFAGGGLGLAATQLRSDLPAPMSTWLLTLLLILCLLTVFAARTDAYDRCQRVVAVLSVGALALVTASLTTGFVALIQTATHVRPMPLAANAPFAWTPAHASALTWLRINSRTGDVLATNRQCSEPQLGAQSCLDTRWFLAAAISQRRLYIEGIGVSGASSPRERLLKERVDVSRRFVDQPSHEDAETLWHAGVRWVVVDLVSTSTRSWMPQAQEVFANDVSIVLRLLPP